MEPDILVMDEPSSDLDPKSRRYLMRLLKGFKHTKIIASHDLDFILEVCERCLVIKDGQIVADGPVSDILTNQSLLEENNLELPLSLQKTQIMDVSPQGGLLSDPSNRHADSIDREVGMATTAIEGVE
jgi:cobalt/nickel transport system ATP-binding protein